jgi:hypothetical protein
VPGVEDDVGADGAEILNEASEGPDSLTSLLPERFQAVACGVEGESQKARGGEHSGQMYFPVSEVVGQVLAVVFQHLEAFILNLQTSSGACSRTTSFEWSPTATNIA